MSISKRFTLFCAFALTLFLFADLSVAQPGRFGGGPPGGGFDRGRDRDRDRDRDRSDWMSRMDPSRMLARADKNGDGKVEPNEIDERFRGFTSRMLQQYGFDPSKPVSLKDLSKKYESKKQKEEKSEEEVSTSFGIPGFDDADETLPPLVPDFFLEADSPLLMTGSMNSRYEKFILDQVDRTLRSSDRNKDGVLDAEEIRRGRFDRPPVSESDLDKDGRLTKIELAERYVARSGGKGRLKDGKPVSSSRSSSSSSSDRSRWDRSRWDRDRRDDDRKGDERRENSSSKLSSSKRSKSSSSKSRSYTGSSRSSSSSRDDKIMNYSKDTLKSHDKNKNGVLDADEAKGIRSLPSNADADKDGKLTVDELYVAYGGKPNSSGSSGRRRSSKNNQYLVPTAEQRADEADRDFKKLDVNVDGLVQMHEFAKVWSDELAESFMEIDVDNNGVLTVNEWDDADSSTKRKATSSSSRSSSSRSSSTRSTSSRSSSSDSPSRTSRSRYSRK